MEVFDDPIIQRPMTQLEGFNQLAKNAPLIEGGLTAYSSTFQWQRNYITVLQS